MASDSVGVFGGETRLVLESVGTADAAALRAIRQLVPGAISDAARIVYQAPSELRTGLHADVAAEMQRLLQGLGFCVSVSRSDTAFAPGVGEFEVALVVRKMETLPAVMTDRKMASCGWNETAGDATVLSEFSERPT